MKPYLLLLTTCCLCAPLAAQTVFHTADIHHFFQAFDSIQTTNDRQRQIDIVQSLYLDPGGRGIEYTVANSQDNGVPATAQHWVDMMTQSKENIQRIRPYFDNMDSQMQLLADKFDYFRMVYPEFKDGNVYLVMGLGRFGGRPEGTDLFIGCEVVASAQADWMVNIVLHEYVHTLQKLGYNALLAHCILEGAADFVAEFVHQKSLRETYPNGYIDFGYQHEKAIWKSFKTFIASNEKGVFFNWLYGTEGRSVKGQKVKDLGYFMGYKICQAYYNNATDKTQAIRDIIELDLSEDEYARAFLLKSGYVPQQDVDFIQGFTFEKVTEQKKGSRMRQYGYTIKKGNIHFVFDLPRTMSREDIRHITVAGTFNGWNPSDMAYQLAPTQGNRYELVLPVSALPATAHAFKFVINGEQWQPVPDFAKNTESGNLTLLMP